MSNVENQDDRRPQLISYCRYAVSPPCFPRTINGWKGTAIQTLANKTRKPVVALTKRIVIDRTSLKLPTSNTNCWHPTTRYGRMKMKSRFINVKVDAPEVDRRLSG
jgi:hypothetical protein